MNDVSYILTKGKRIPVWFMRQAGRHMPKFKELVKDMSITDVTVKPELAAEIAAEPVFLLGVDASIIFMDITTPLELLGFKFKYVKGRGPVYVDELNKIYSDVKLDLFERWEPIKEQIRLLKKIKLNVIGFGAGPFTLMTYLLNDEHKDKLKTKEFLYRSTIEKLSPLAELLIEQARFQFLNGIDAFQIFDSWAGSLSGSLLESYVKVLNKVFNKLKEYSKRTIYFCRSCNVLLNSLAATNFEGYLSVDWNCDFKAVHKSFNGRVGLQGNLDPFYAYVGGKSMLDEANKVLSNVPDYSRYVFNLGHGVLPGTPVKNLRLLAEHVKNWQI
ncbi:MAG: uroporphyrinogen decarboxylase family protein [Nitrososphaeria archaeon]